MIAEFRVNYRSAAYTLEYTVYNLLVDMNTSSAWSNDVIFVLIPNNTFAR